MKVECTIAEVIIPNEDGVEVDGVSATCSRCDHEVESFGTSERSIKRCLAVMREECPNEETNYYVADDGGGESRMPDPVVKPWWQKG